MRTATRSPGASKGNVGFAQNLRKSQDHTPAGEFGNFYKYLSREILGDYAPADQLQQRKQQEITHFFQTPVGLEQLLLFGFFLCFDAFLFLFTFLCPRVLVSAGSVLWSIITRRPLRGSALFDLLRGIIFCVCCYVLYNVDVSMVYHYIRGQAVIKLYVIYNLLEVFDKLCCAFGQDIFDALFTRMTVPRPSDSTFLTILQSFVALIYVVIHSLVLFHQVITLNVAMNSYSNSLITLLVSNQFVELKGCVFKKFAKENLFQICCSDMVERFQISVFLCVIIVQNLSDLNWDVSTDWIVGVVWTIVTVIGSEMIVDWLKHCFVIKFNHLEPSLYRKYLSIFASDVLAQRLNPASLDSHAIARRVGFVPLPLACLLFRVFWPVLPFHGVLGAVLCFLVWACLLALKTLLRIQLLGMSLIISRYLKNLILKGSASISPAQDEDLASLSDVQRYKMCNGKIA